MKKNNRINVRINDEEMAFLKKLEKIIGDTSSAVRFCLNFTQLHLNSVISDEDRAEKLVTALEKAMEKL